MNVTITGAVTHRCPYKDEQDYGTVVISYDCEGEHGPIEFGMLRATLDLFAERAVTHEMMTAELTEEFAPYGAQVTTHWQTAGLEVKIG